MELLTLLNQKSSPFGTLQYNTILDQKLLNNYVQNLIVQRHCCVRFESQKTAFPLVLLFHHHHNRKMKLLQREIG